MAPELRYTNVVLKPFCVFISYNPNNTYPIVLGNEIYPPVLYENICITNSRMFCQKYHTLGVKGLKVNKCCPGLTLGRGAGTFVKLPYSTMFYLFFVGVPRNHLSCYGDNNSFNLLGKNTFSSHNSNLMRVPMHYQSLLFKPLFFSLSQCQLKTGTFCS